jgi:hypothetical protein
MSHTITITSAQGSLYDRSSDGDLVAAGPTKKRPGYQVSRLATDCLGRSHRSKLGKAKLKLAIEVRDQPLNARTARHDTLQHCAWS